MPKIKIFKKPKKVATSFLEINPEGGSIESTTERKNKRNWTTTSTEIKPDGTKIETSETRKGRNIEKTSDVSGKETASSYTIKEKVSRKPLFGFLGSAKKKNNTDGKSND